MMPHKTEFAMQTAYVARGVLDRYAGMLANGVTPEFDARAMKVEQLVANAACTLLGAAEIDVRMVLTATSDGAPMEYTARFNHAPSPTMVEAAAHRMPETLTQPLPMRIEVAACMLLEAIAVLGKPTEKAATDMVGAVRMIDPINIHVNDITEEMWTFLKASHGVEDAMATRRRHTDPPIDFEAAVRGIGSHSIRYQMLMHYLRMDATHGMTIERFMCCDIPRQLAAAWGVTTEVYVDPIEGLWCVQLTSDNYCTEVRRAINVDEITHDHIVNEIVVCALLLYVKAAMYEEDEVVG